MAKWVYTFGRGHAEGHAGLKDLLGGKGANLAEMVRMGLPVPPGFTLTTEVCTYYYTNQQTYPQTLKAEVEAALNAMGAATGRIFGEASKPLLVSVRSGSRASMPGMMDTVLNLGLTDASRKTLAQETMNPRFAADSGRRFVQMYANVVLGVDHHLFEDEMDLLKSRRGVQLDTELHVDDLEALIETYKTLVLNETGRPFPDDPHEQLWGAIGAVFKSWMNTRAITYRRLHDIPESWGTAVTVQAMVFGNLGETSATGVAFTRNPSNGSKETYGEFLINAQGEDVVAGLRTPQSVTEVARRASGSSKPSMETALPAVYQQFQSICSQLEAHTRDMQDIEFTVERGHLWVLQTRSGKRTTRAAIKIAVDMAHEGLITREEAILRIDPQSLDQLLHPTLDPKAPRHVLAVGLPASPGAAVGEIVFTADEAEDARAMGRSVILVRTETSPEDIHGMHAAVGILTCRGGMTSHAAVVARGMGKPCVSGTSHIRLEEATGLLHVGEVTLRRGDTITLDGSTGQVMVGAMPLVQPELSGDFATLMGWADSARRLKVRANAETPQDARNAISFGAEGIGLCRTEHMFFEAERITAMRQMIVAKDEQGRKHALAKLLPMQKQDFVELFRIMKGLPVTIRLLDPPLHEFLPHSEDDISIVAEQLSLQPDDLKQRLNELAETNPMLGFRGCRLAILYPEIYDMQAEAIFLAASEVKQKSGDEITLEIMVPLVATEKELATIAQRIQTVADRIKKDHNTTFHYHIGTMIELPRAALCADEIAQSADFFSFGTNDLTQTALGLSRDDAGRFLGAYVTRGLFEKDPFVSLDQTGVGQLIKIAVGKGRNSKPDLKIGICGEHGGDPASIHFFHAADLDYVSCSPYRVPVARLAAAQAAMKAKEKGL